MKFSYTFFLLLTLLLTSCGHKKVVELTEEPTIEAPKAIVAEDFRSFGGSAPVAIEKVDLSKNILSIYVKYSGGCKEHDFQLIGHRMVTQSQPPKRSVRLFHDTNDDDCREIVQDVLLFDISALAYNYKETIIALDNYSDDIRYTPN